MKKAVSIFSLIIIMLVAGCKPTAQTSLDHITAGENVPNDIYVIIEIPANSDPVKYEMNKKSGTLFVDRFPGSKMRYPANYGYIPHTLSNDGDPADVLVITPYPVMSGAVIRARPIAVLLMEDEAGLDGKIVAVPVDKLSSEYSHIQSKADVDPVLINEIELFFTNYKKAEAGKWVKIHGWGDAAAARREITESVERGV